ARGRDPGGLRRGRSVHALARARPPVQPGRRRRSGLRRVSHRGRDRGPRRGFEAAGARALDALQAGRPPAQGLRLRATGGHRMNADDDRELSEADRLLRRADALLQRHRVLEEDDDLPLVTDIVDDLPPPAAPAPISAPPTNRMDPPKPAARHDPAAHIAQAERLVEIDTVVQRAVEAWVAAELPAIIERELSLAADR